MHVHPTDNHMAIWTILQSLNFGFLILFGKMKTDSFFQDFEFEVFLGFACKEPFCVVEFSFHVVIVWNRTFSFCGSRCDLLLNRRCQKTHETELVKKCELKKGHVKHLPAILKAVRRIPQSLVRFQHKSFCSIKSVASVFLLHSTILRPRHVSSSSTKVWFTSIASFKLNDEDCSIFLTTSLSLRKNCSKSARSLFTWKTPPFETEKHFGSSASWVTQKIRHLQLLGSETLDLSKQPLINNLLSNIIHCLFEFKVKFLDLKVHVIKC